MEIQKNKITKIKMSMHKLKNNIKSETKGMNIFNPFYWYKLFHKHRIIHFLFTGGTGVLINLCITAFFAELIFGRENYFYAYLIGLFSNLIYNFVLHTKLTFKTKDKHTKRFTLFIIYSLLISFIQAILIKFLVNIIGTNYYLIVISSTILTFSIITFIVFKLWIFKE